MSRDKIFIYDLRGMELKQRLDVDQHLGRVFMAPNPSDNYPYMLYSNSFDGGKFVVYDLDSLCEKRVILAHKSPIQKIVTNFEGNLAASISTKGDIIRLWNL